MKNQHQPVLLEQTISLLDPKPNDAYLDGTAGYGGHAAAIIPLIGTGNVVLVDRDNDAIAILEERFGNRATIMHQNYVQAAQYLADTNRQFDVILLDLGVSSPQFDQTSRGFSFKSEADLDMRMDRRESLTAAEVVNTYRESQLADIIYRYGEEPRSRAIARAICARRPIESGKQLAEIIRGVVRKTSGIDGATRTFQAIRIEVNAELQSLEAGLPLLVNLLRPGGRLAIISFHSLEDRLVKQFFETESRDCICPPKQPICTCGHVATIAKLTTKAISGLDQDANNPRARSAKLRAAVKLKQNQKGG